MVVISSAALLGYGSWHNNQLDSYLLKHSQGVLTLIVDGVQRHRGDAQKQWLELARRVTSLDIEIHQSAPSSQARTLPNGVMIETLGAQQRIVYLPLQVTDTAHWLRVALAQSDINQQFIRGSQLLILNELGRYPRDQRETRLKHLSRSFSAPLEWLDSSELSLNYLQQRAAARGDTVVEFLNIESGDLAMRAISPIGNSGDFLVQALCRCLMHYRKA